MSALLSIASRVEAAVEAYISVQDFSDREEWLAGFKQELRGTAEEFNRISSETGAPPPLPPTLAALCIALDLNEDFGRINRSHPRLGEHKYYDPDAKFPLDITDLLPSGADRWWEQLAEASRTRHAAQTTPRQVPEKKKRVNLKVGNPPAKNQKEKGSEDVPMDVDEGHGDFGSTQEPAASKGASRTRKRKVSIAAPRTTSKRRSVKNKPAEPAEQGSAAGDVGQDSDESLKIECDRCVKAGINCDVRETSACRQCNEKKLRCSLIPTYDDGRPIRRQLSAGTLRRFRLEKARENKKNAASKAVKKGKQRARESPDLCESEEGSAPAPNTPSPMAGLAALGDIALDSAGSSNANTPADSPATAPQPPLPGGRTAAPPQDPKTSGASGSFGGTSTPEIRVAALAQHLKGIRIEAPGASQLLRPGILQAGGKDEKNNADKIAALEKRVAELEKCVGVISAQLAKSKG